MFILGSYYESLLGVKTLAARTLEPLRVRVGDMGGCQNYGPFLHPFYHMAPSI